MSNEILSVADNDVLLITINRPQARNALDGVTSRALAAQIDRLEEVDDLRVGVLTGAGGAFCAGMDLKAFLVDDTPEIPGRGMGGITSTPPRKPLIAAVEGWALAGGLELMLACDLVVAGESARFGVPEVKRGLVAGGGAAIRLSRRIPHAVAMELLLSGDPIDAGRAAELGLVNAVVADGEAVERALDLGRRIAANAPLAVAATKAVVVRAVAWDEAEAFDHQRELIDRVFRSADAREGARAFAEKREPVWRGV